MIEGVAGAEPALGGREGAVAEVQIDMRSAAPTIPALPIARGAAWRRYAELPSKAEVAAAVRCPVLLIHGTAQPLTTALAHKSASADERKGVPSVLKNLGTLVAELFPSSSEHGSYNKEKLALQFYPP